MTTAIPAPGLTHLPCIHGAEEYPEEKLRLLLVSPPPEFLLAKTYDVMMEDGTLPMLLFEYLPDRDGFVEWLSSRHVRCAVGMLCPTLDNTLVEIAGIGVIWNIYVSPDGVLCGEVGTAFRHKFQNHRIPQRLVAKMLDLTFGPLGFEILATVAPVINLPAMRFMKSMGFHRSCVIPRYRQVGGYPCDCQVSLMSAPEWKEKSRDLR